MTDFHDFPGGTRKFDDFGKIGPKNPLIFSLKSGGPQNFISKKGGHQPIEAKIRKIWKNEQKIENFDEF